MSRRLPLTTRDYLRQLESLRPRNADELHRFLKVLLGLRVPRKPVVSGNSAPFDYLLHSFFDDSIAADPHGPAPQHTASDTLVWANRGGGKTYLGAVATLLDLAFKPGIQVRILGGSFEQSSKMHRYLRRLVEQPIFRPLLAHEPTERRIELMNGSAVELLSQSHRSVRGQRVHKLRCDEVDEFKPDVWDAAQLTTRSGRCGPHYVHGTIEALSTMHRPFGLMNRLVDRAQRQTAPHHTHGTDGANAQTTPARGPVKLFRWCAIDVIARCPAQRDCSPCVLWPDCQGRAKNADGFVPVDDLVAQWRRTSTDVWASEMMCQRPRRSDSVYPNFNPTPGLGHVTAIPPSTQIHTHATPETAPDDASSTRETPHADTHPFSPESGDWLVGGMDFGLRSPFVMLWATVRKPRSPLDTTDALIVEVLDEYVEQGLTLEQHLAVIAKRPWPMPRWVGVDPAAGQRNSQTGLSDAQVLRRYGYRVRAQRSTIREGIERIRRRLDRGTLLISPSCPRLIEAMSLYHFDRNHPQDDLPVKDGPDHACDALRYLVVNLERGSGKVTIMNYM